MFQKMMMVMAAVSLLVVPASAQHGVLAAMNCLEDGESVTLCHSQKVADDITISAEVYESDPGLDDPMGSAKVEQTGEMVYKISAEIINDGCNLKGPNGEIQNGAGEGRCIEVTFKVTVAWPATITIGFISVQSQLSKTSNTNPQEICPC